MVTLVETLVAVLIDVVALWIVETAGVTVDCKVLVERTVWIVVFVLAVFEMTTGTVVVFVLRTVD